MKQISSKAYRIQIQTLLPVFVNVFMIGCTYGWTPNAISFFQIGTEVKATAYEWSLLATSTEVGRLISAIPSGICVDRFGRRKTIIVSGVLNVLCWILLSITSSINVIILAWFAYIILNSFGRYYFTHFSFISGIGVALEDATTFITIGEIASHEIRAELIGMYYIFLISGKLFQGIVSILFSSYFVLSYCSLAVSCTFFISLCWILETPYHLISASKFQEARMNLEYIRPECTRKEIDFEFDSMQTYILDEKEKKLRVNWIQFLNSESIRKPLITCVSISFFSLATGLNLINAYITIIIPENDIIPSKYYPLITQVVLFIIALVTPLYMEVFSRRTLYLMGAVLVCFINFTLTVSDYCYSENHNDLFRWIILFVIFLHLMISSGAVHPMGSAMKSELFPQSVKGFGSSLCVIVQSLANIILYQSYNLITANWGQYYVFMILAANSLILCLLIYFRLPEARGRFLAELQKHPDETIASSMKTQTLYGTVIKEEI